jgi:hypothetical protein
MASKRKLAMSRGEFGFVSGAGRLASWNSPETVTVPPEQNRVPVGNGSPHASARVAPDAFRYVTGTEVATLAALPRNSSAVLSRLSCRPQQVTSESSGSERLRRT